MRGIIDSYNPSESQTYEQRRQQINDYINTAPDHIIDRIHTAIIQIESKRQAQSCTQAVEKLEIAKKDLNGDFL